METKNLSNAELSSWECESSITNFLPALVLAVSLAVTQQLWKYERETDKVDASTHFTLRKNEIRRKIEERLKDYGYALLWSRSVFAGDIDRQKEFHSFIQDMKMHNNIPWAIYAFSPLVREADLIDHISKIQKELYPNYEISPEGVRWQYAPSIYIEPLEPSKKDIGYDALSDARRRPTMEKARDENRIKMTSKVRVIENPLVYAEFGFVMYLPVYKQGLPYSTQSERMENVAGWLASSIKIDEFITEMKENKLFDGLHVEIYDAEASEDSLLFDNAVSDNVLHDTSQPAFRSQETIDTFWRPWLIRVDSLPGFESSVNNGRSIIVLISWVWGSCFLTFLSWFLLYGKKRALNMAKDMNTELIESEQRLSLIIRANMDAIVQLDSTGIVTSWGGQSEKIFGFSEQEAIGKKLSDLIIPERYREAYHRGFENSAHSDAPRSVSSWKIRKMWAIRKDGTEFPVELSVARIPWKNGYEFCGFIRDITEQQEAAEKIIEMAMYDALTGLPNRNLLSDRLEQAIHNSERTDTSCAVLFVDLDRFKPVNDTYWHKIGDWVLKEVAKRLHDIMRSIDTVARFWGDEFVIVVPELQLENDVDSIVEKIVQTISIPFSIEEKEICISASIGVSFFPRDGNNQEELLKYSDKAMYQVKNNGKSLS